MIHLFLIFSFGFSLIERAKFYCSNTYIFYTFLQSIFLFYLGSFTILLDYCASYHFYLNFFMINNDRQSNLYRIISRPLRQVISLLIFRNVFRATLFRTFFFFSLSIKIIYGYLFCRKI